eukprot:GCRY01006299.1.p1 GENE.GCRY01006299.1~~GCRY01006299.1.p1  ORF type:complete len:113 (+),score=6.43 GCRY01006299.1:260-598(+)
MMFTALEFKNDWVFSFCLLCLFFVGGGVVFCFESSYSLHECCLMMLGFLIYVLCFEFFFFSLFCSEGSRVLCFVIVKSSCLLLLLCFYLFMVGSFRELHNSLSFSVGCVLVL